VNDPSVTIGASKSWLISTERRESLTPIPVDAFAALNGLTGTPRPPPPPAPAPAPRGPPPPRGPGNAEGILPDTRPEILRVCCRTTVASVVGFTVVTGTTPDARTSFVASMKYVPGDSPVTLYVPHALLKKSVSVT
jgi:hypothetical protein